MLQNLTWSGLYMRINFLSALLQKILKLVPPTETRPEVYVTTMNTVLSNYYNSLVDTLNQTKSLKLKDHSGGNVTYCCDVILVDLERLESAGAFKLEHLGYTTHIFEGTSDSRFHLWATQKYKEVMDFVNNFVCATKTLCGLMISLPMAPLFEKLLLNTATLLTQRGGNPLIVRKIIKISLYFWRLPLWQLNIQ